LDNGFQTVKTLPDYPPWHKVLEIDKETACSESTPQFPADANDAREELPDIVLIDGKEYAPTNRWSSLIKFLAGAIIGGLIAAYLL
jgi:hypothetical protein